MHLVDHALAHLRGEKRNAGMIYERREHLRGELAIGAGTDHQKRPTAVADCIDRFSDGLVLGQRPARVRGRQHPGIGVVARDVFRQLQMRRPGTFLLGLAERFAHPRRHRVGRDDLPRVLGQRPHHVDHVDDLEMPLLARLDRLLSGDHQHRHGAQLRVGGRGDQVGRPRTQRTQADASLAGQPAVGRCHEASGLFVACQDQADARGAQRFEKIEVLLARQPEDVVDTLLHERLDHQFRRFHALLSFDALHCAFKSCDGSIAESRCRHEIDSHFVVFGRVHLAFRCGKLRFVHLPDQASTEEWE
jgi:hypothetical protein